jgi:hypothetical protein
MGADRIVVGAMGDGVDDAAPGAIKAETTRGTVRVTRV